MSNFSFAASFFQFHPFYQVYKWISCPLSSSLRPSELHSNRSSWRLYLDLLACFGSIFGSGFAEGRRGSLCLGALSGGSFPIGAFFELQADRFGTCSWFFATFSWQVTFSINYILPLWWKQCYHSMCHCSQGGSVLTPGRLTYSLSRISSLAQG